MKRYLHILIVLFWAANSFSQNRVTVKAESTVSESIIRLRDVAEVTGPNKSSLDSLEVGRIITPGTARMVLRDELFLFTAISNEIKSTIALEGESRCRVAMKSRDIFLKDIESDLREMILNELSWDRDHCKISFRCEESNLLARIGIGDYKISLGSFRSKTMKGNNLIQVTVNQGDFKEQFMIQTLIEVSAEVYVSSRRIEVGERVDQSDFSRQRMDISLLPSTPVIALNEGETYKVKGGIIPQGTVLMTNRIQKSALIETGQTVSLMAKVGNASLIISGIARESGEIGDRIAVENSSSKKIIRGTVIEPGIVRVDQGGGV